MDKNKGELRQTPWPGNSIKMNSKMSENENWTTKYGPEFSPVGITTHPQLNCFHFKQIITNNE